MDDIIELGQTEILLRSDKVGDLLNALATATKAFRPIKKDRENDHFKNRYASLNAYQEATRKPLADNGLVIIQLVQHNVLYTRLYHTSEQWIQSTVPLSSTVKGPQVFGGELTYLKRYCYGAILNISADEDDDDGNAAQQEASKRTPDRRTQQPARQSTPDQGNQQLHRDERTFAERAAALLDAEKNGTKWLKALDVVYSKAQSLDDIGSVRTINSFKAAKANAATLIKGQIDDMERAAIIRVSPQFNGDETPGESGEALTGTAKSTMTTADAKLETERVGKPVNTVEEAKAVAAALTADKPVGEEWMPGDL